MITNEIFRRVEPQGRTMAEYVEQQLRPNFGFDGIYPLLNKEDDHLEAKFKSVPLRLQFKNG